MQRTLHRVVRLVRLFDLRVLSAVLWAASQHRGVRRRLAVARLRDLTVAPPPVGAPDGVRWAVVAALRLRRATCLHRSLVLQAWDRAHGRSRSIVIGVTSPTHGFRAHAWLDGDAHSRDGDGFEELLRIEP